MHTDSLLITTGKGREVGQYGTNRNGKEEEKEVKDMSKRYCQFVV